MSYNENFQYLSSQSQQFQNFQAINNNTPSWKRVSNNGLGYVDMPYKTDIILGHFNPDDNKTEAEMMREYCNPCMKSYKPVVPPYPCRVAIRYPEQRLVSSLENFNPYKYPSICEDYEETQSQNQQQ